MPRRRPSRRRGKKPKSWEPKRDRVTKSKRKRKKLCKGSHEDKRMCARKRCYVTREQAESMAMRRLSYGVELRVYKCPICHGWHLTSKV